MPPSSIVVQLGQCGTQLGHQLFKTMHKDATVCPKGYPSTQNENYKSASLETYFNESASGYMEARSVMVDMEQKVVNQALESASKDGGWVYPAQGQFCQKLGSGNNWSFGFCVHGPKCENEIIDLLQRESEKCDQLSGFVVIMSLAGGTGSGLGSYVIQILKDHFPNSLILNPIIAPYKAGEVAVQNYNAVFTLSCALSHASGSILFHNDHLHSICSKSLHIDKVSINDLNNVASHQLASVLMPSVESSTKTHAGLQQRNQNILFDIIRSTSCHSQYKLLSLRCVPHIAEKSVPFSTFSWPGLLKHIKQMHLTNFFVDEGMDWQVRVDKSMPSYGKRHSKSIGNLFIFRGEDSSSQNMENLQEIIDPRLYCSWLQPNERCHIWSSNRSFRNYEKSVSLLSNNSFCTEGLDSVIGKAWDMFSSKAYVHQYSKYGLEDEDFLNSFVKVESIVNSYKAL